ncbi:MAG: hypothetical protein ACYSTT_21810 [Planctomycetota bacterium]|jgi:hypothetical protein
MKERITRDKAWLMVWMLFTTSPLLSTIAMASKPAITQQTTMLSAKEHQKSLAAVKMKSIDSMPSDPVFKDHSPQELITYILGKKQLEGLKNEGKEVWDLACSWFMWKTQSQLRLREQLADAIFIELHCVKRQHDNSHLSVLLGMLEMPDHLTALLEVLDVSDCCYGPSLIQGLVACSSVDYAPILIKTFDKEGEGSRGCVQASLIKMTGCPPEQNKTKEDWIAWWRKAYPNKDLGPPSYKYRQLLEDDRIVLIQNLRNIMSAIYKYGENKIDTYQLGSPSFPANLSELIGREYTPGKRITEKHIQSVKYRKAPKDVCPPYDFLILADDSLEKTHGLIAVLHGEGRIHLVKPDTSEEKSEMIRMFWPEKWNNPTQVVRQ